MPWPKKKIHISFSSDKEVNKVMSKQFLHMAVRTFSLHSNRGYFLPKLPKQDFTLQAVTKSLPINLQSSYTPVSGLTNQNPMMTQRRYDKREYED